MHFAWILVRFAAQYGHFEIAKYLLEKGANPNLRAKDQLDPLLSAIDFGHKEIIQLLISHGANVHTKVWFNKSCNFANLKNVCMLHTKCY